MLLPLVVLLSLSSIGTSVATPANTKFRQYYKDIVPAEYNKLKTPFMLIDADKSCKKNPRCVGIVQEGKYGMWSTIDSFSGDVKGKDRQGATTIVYTKMKTTQFFSQVANYVEQIDSTPRPPF